MSLRPRPGSALVVALVAAVAALAVAAWLVARSADVYATQEARVADATERAFSRLSTTIDAAARGTDPADMTPDVRERLLPVMRERAKARRDFDDLTSASALFAVIVVVAVALAVAALRSSHRERMRVEARLAAEMTHDALTGLPNRRFFSDWLAFAIGNAKREQARVGVLYIDIGGCASVAEHHGGPAVEALLVEIARRFRATSRDGDVFARLGPTEFALATPNAQHVRELATIAQRLRDVLIDPAQPPLADTPIGTSIGLAFYPEDAGDSAGVMAAANAAMYAARRAGRNHVAFNALAA